MLKRTLLRSLDHLLDLNGSSIAIYACAADHVIAPNRLHQTIVIQEIEDAIHFAELTEFAKSIGAAPEAIDWDTASTALRDVGFELRPRAILETLVATKTHLCDDYQDALRRRYPKMLKALLRRRHAQLQKHAMVLVGELQRQARPRSNPET